MNYREWENKVEGLRYRVEMMTGIELLGPEQLKKFEKMILEMEKYLDVRKK